MKFDNCSKLEKDLQVANRIKHSELSSWERNFWFSSQEKNCLLWAPQINRIHKTATKLPTLVLFGAALPDFFIITLDIMSSILRHSRRSFFSNFSAMYVRISDLSNACCRFRPPYPHWSDILIMCDKKYKLWNFLWHIHRPSVSSWLVGTNTPFRTLLNTSEYTLFLWVPTIR